MALTFSCKDFFLPIEISKRVYSFSKSQWYSSGQFQDLSFNLLQALFEESISNIPYYRENFLTLGLSPKINSLADIDSYPILSRAKIAAAGKQLLSAKGRTRSAVSTSGSSGCPLSLQMDAAANALEFAYYLRFWGWHGYSLGSSFAELSTYSFSQGDESLYKYNYFLKRLILNSRIISGLAVTKQHDLLKTQNVKFLKASPASLYYFVLKSMEVGIVPIKLKALFTSGEVLSDKMRSVIQEYFGCKVFDSYGQMERVVAASECEYQKLHINSDYGYAELLPTESEGVVRIIGTGFYNKLMPLLRYEIGDLVEFDPSDQNCKCGRNFPIIKRVLGRENDVIRLADGRIFPAAYLVFDDLDDVQSAQIVQEDFNRLTLKIIPKKDWSTEAEERLSRRVRSFFNVQFELKVEILANESDFDSTSSKFRSIVSKISS